MDVFTAIHSRRSHPLLVEPGPSSPELRHILCAAVTAPDHGRQRPWRFVVLSGEHKDTFANVLEKAYRNRTPIPHDEGRVARERARLSRAPLVLVTACPMVEGDRIPRHEQLAAAAAATQNVLLAATALGYGSMWRTGWPARDEYVKEGLGLASNDDIAAFVYIGTVPADRDPRPRPAAAIEDYVQYGIPGAVPDQAGHGRADGATFIRAALSAARAAAWLPVSGSQGIRKLPGTCVPLSRPIRPRCRACPES